MLQSNYTRSFTQQHEIIRLSKKKKTLMLKNLRKEIGSDIKSRLVMYCDNQAAIDSASNPIIYERTKQVDCHFIREVVMKGKVVTPLSEDLIGVLFTKVAHKRLFLHFCSKLSMKDKMTSLRSVEVGNNVFSIFGRK